MKTKCFILLLLSFLLYMTEINACLLFGVEIPLTGNDEPFDSPDGTGTGSRSIPMVIPFSAFLNDDHSINLDFYQAIGEIEVVISQNGTMVYFSTEYIDTPILKRIQLPKDLSGNFLLEIKWKGEGHIFGWFSLF